MDRIRSELIEMTKKYKASWFPDLGELLYKVKNDRLYRSWSDKNGNKFRSFTKYSEHDLHICSSVASDIVLAYGYIATHHKKMIENFPSDGKIPGYNDIVILLRAKNKISDNDFESIDKMLFNDQIGRDKLRKRLRDLVPGKESRVKKLEEDIENLWEIIFKLEEEIQELRNCRLMLSDLKEPEINKLKRRVAMYIHPDHGGNNDVMRDFNVLMDKLLTTVNTN